MADRSPQSLVRSVLGSSVAALIVLAALEWPATLWLTPGQRADRLQSAERYLDAAELYSDPLRQGAAYFRGGDFEAAGAAFARLDEPEAAFDRGNALVMLGRYDDALKAYDRALQLSPGWVEAEENRAIAAARRDRMRPPEDDAGGTGGRLEADEVVFDDRAADASQTEEIEVGTGEQLSDEELRGLWLRRVQTQPGDFLRSKFAYQYAKRQRLE